MAILGIGVDVVHIPRFAALLSRRCPRRLAARILSEEELTQWGSLPTSDMFRRIRFLAVRWCLKEAAYKAMYPEMRPTWKELTYRGLCPRKDGLKPALVYHPIIAVESTKVGRMHISISHDGDYVIAFVTIEASTKGS
ncbi:4'-phosphopantetheinyl transferase [Tricholoma matsutake]|nr:4'-phosphopantetheinyl transferase [Tricholoma matsutake 945]